MPRSHPAKPLTLLLPPLPSSSSTPSYETASASASITNPAPSPAPSLDFLLLAQKLAAEKGQVLDVESFMTIAQKNEYYTSILHRSPPPSPIPRKRPSVTEFSDAGSPITPDGQSPSHTSKKPRMPNLSHLHWRQRQKKLAEWAKAAEAAEAREAATPSTPPPPLEVKEEKEKAKSKGETDVASLLSSASYWNHLLIQARQERGPQWDYHSQSYHVDRHSKTYYNHGKEPRQDLESEPKIKTELTPASFPNPHSSSTTPSSIMAPGVPTPLTNGIQTNGHGPSPSPAASTPHRRSSDIPPALPHSISVNPTPSPHAAQSHHLPPTSHQQPMTPHNPIQPLQSPHHPSVPAHTQPPSVSTPQQQTPGSGHFQQRLSPHIQAQFGAAQAGSGSPMGPGSFPRPANATPPMGLTPQQLAQLSQLSHSGTSNSSIHTAMAQLVRQNQLAQGSPAPGNPAHTQPGSLNPAQLSNLGNMGHFNQPGMPGGQIPGGINVSQLGPQGGQQQVGNQMGFNMSSVGSNGMTPTRSQTGQGPMLGAGINWQEFAA